jgi:hypothetical protein
MALVHNCILRGFNSIYNQALDLDLNEYKNFIPYAHALYLGLESHHTGEETHEFPAIEAATGVKGLMDVNVAQHGKPPISNKTATFGITLISP